MSSLQNQLANEMFHKTLWWSYVKQCEEEVIHVSEGLQAYLGRPVVLIEDIMGEYETQLLRLKINEALNESLFHQSDKEDIRFVASYETVKGKRTFQHQLRVFERKGEKIVWSTCLDVSEMAALEREMVDAQGRLSLQQVVERERHIENQNRFVNESYIKQSRFLAMLSHELRSPLLGISSMVRRLRNEMDASPETLNVLKTIHMTAEQSTYLVNDILTYSQTEYDGIKLHPTEVSLTELLESVKQLTKSIGSDKNLVISLVYLGRHDYVLADGVRLTQILINLIVNGIKFTQYGGVNIEVTEKDDGIFVFKITDSGEGIPADRLQRIFEPFAQLEANDGGFTSNTTYLGAGLGLFVVKQLVELMNGVIDVHSAVGVGTSFEFCLKLPCLSEEDSEKKSQAKVSFNRPEKQPVRIGSEVPEKTELNREKQYQVLIADDSKINRMVLAGYLADLHCEVIEAKDGREAWELFQKHAFDYVLLDIQMPFMDGLQVSQKIQKSYENGQAQQLKGVFAITAGGDSSGFIENELGHEGLGFDKWLVKPVGKNQITTLLDKNYRVTSNQEHKALIIENDKSDLELSSKPHIEKSEEKDNSLHTIHDIPEQFHHLYDSFMLETQAGLERLHRYNLQNEYEEIKKLAHYLKGNCMLFQLPGLVDLFKELENIQEKLRTEVLDKQARLEKSEATLQKIVLILKSLEKSASISHNKGM